MEDGFCVLDEPPRIRFSCLQDANGALGLRDTLVRRGLALLLVVCLDSIAFLSSDGGAVVSVHPVGGVDESVMMTSRSITVPWGQRQDGLPSTRYGRC